MVTSLHQAAAYYTLSDVWILPVSFKNSTEHFDLLMLERSKHTTGLLASRNHMAIVCCKLGCQVAVL